MFYISMFTISVWIHAIFATNYKIVVMMGYIIVIGLTDFFFLQKLVIKGIAWYKDKPLHGCYILYRTTYLGQKKCPCKMFS